ncbi:hypothetical protein AURDEDRAFT_164173 [Auricularia subglabra TFB-10046 SS5]|nr:hypothetical protein AURDEDRAFT_164173 [Auricularia subglabra TFB-10046 SS5]
MSWSSASALSSELFDMVVDHMEVQDVVRLLRVCGQWRRAARAHPTFWRDVSLSGTSKKDLAFFNARLNSTTDVGVRLNIPLYHFEGSSHAEARASILHTITRNLHRTASLMIWMGQKLAEETFSAMRKPAPLLQELCLYCEGYKGSPGLIPSDLLAGSCPLLKRMQLVDCILPRLPVRAFMRVERLLYEVDAPAALSTNLFEHFPVVKDLFIISTAARDGKDFFPQFKRAPALDDLNIESRMVDLGTLFATCPRLVKTPTIKFTHHKDALNILARQLPKPLGLELSAFVDDTIFTVVSRSRGWRRTCRFPSAARDQWPGPDFFSSKEIGRHIKTLSMEHTLSFYVPSRICELPSCEVLDISVGRYLCGPSTPQERLSLPAWTNVVVRPISGKPRVTVDAKELAGFLENLIGRCTPRVPLDLAGVSLSGDVMQLEADYIFLADVVQ